ncbi:uncharacterized protein LOC123562101 [Mercenaria mercenaria]|uniref:uncharacterized protein LOC123562101 n=1 Tax=Mercenaria mercenaria TaxID=6596 RepID=UPI00234FAD9E|nr:uncharacterized protein LOC123562101 [Mercenaria mercenaria]
MGCSSSSSSHGKDKRKSKNTSSISQWVKKVTKFSSQYDSTGWSANCLAGPPNVYPDYGDRTGAWAPEHIDDKQFLEFKYDEAVYIKGIDIYETYHGGGVTSIQGRDDKGNWKTLWKADKATVIQSSRIFSPKLDLQDFKCKTSEIRLEIDCTACGTWVEIDAVELHGSKKISKGKLSQWVARVTKFSSQYDNDGWSANSVVGSPKVYPNYGDSQGTWAQGDIDDKQFIEVEYNEAVKVKGIDIYETYHAGGVTAIRGLSAKGSWETLWKTDKPEVITSSRIFSPKLHVKDLKGPTKNIRIEVDCLKSQTWVEIDAVQLHGRSVKASDDSDSDCDSD